MPGYNDQFGFLWKTAAAKHEQFAVRDNSSITLHKVPYKSSKTS